jgi:hypothetical protein
MYCVTATLPHARYRYDADTLDTTPACTPASTHTAGRTTARNARARRPYAAFVASPGYTTVLNSVSTSRPDARPCRGLQYHPQHVPRPQPAPRSFLVAGAAFVAFSYATAIYCLHPLDARRSAHPQHNTDIPAPAAVPTTDLPTEFLCLSAMLHPTPSCLLPTPSGLWR